MLQVQSWDKSLSADPLNDANKGLAQSKPWSHRDRDMVALDLVDGFPGDRTDFETYYHQSVDSTLTALSSPTLTITDANLLRDALRAGEVSIREINFLTPIMPAVLN